MSFLVRTRFCTFDKEENSAKPDLSNVHFLFEEEEEEIAATSSLPSSSSSPFLPPSDPFFSSPSSKPFISSSKLFNNKKMPYNISIRNLHEYETEVASKHNSTFIMDDF
eukprot:TRINITY_DN18311_c0_g1_i1.p2 TRINITY_DN18311_c0_g1~~TRINITY_DN18311_c0_g1_i1.p2  ORF type:complete len:109 (+),score=39.94 TRINITY_DN18311_c0_g1_i1:68-394(+)